MALKASEMTAAMEKALKAEWQKAKDEALSDDYAEDRRLLFAAIARGVLEYLEDHENEIFKEITLQQKGTTQLITYAVKKLDLNVQK
jgi:hypothetical protein